MSNIVFKEESVVIPKILSPGEKYTVVFEFEGDPSEILHIAPGCGCTANCVVVGNTIQADYTDQTSSDAQKGIFDFNKSLRVFLQDEKDLWIQDGMNKVINNQKTNKTIKFSGKVQVK